MKVDEIELASTVAIPNVVISTKDAVKIQFVPTAEKSLIEIKKVCKLLKYIRIFTKRTVDIVGGIVGTILLIPITIFIAIANFISGDRGPIFYTQDRIGKNGKIFKMYKYRSMCVDADEKLNKLLAQNEEARKEYCTYKKLKDDPRITKIGKVLRKTSLDELPQLINVLKGEMSLVGPRPYLPKEKEDMKYFYTNIIKNKPGITGPWQVSGRNETTFEERCFIESLYAFKFSLFYDLKILFKTIKSVITRKGAI